MKNSNTVQPNKNALPLSPADSGLIYSIAALTSIAVSLIFTIGVSFAANIKGEDVGDFTARIGGSFWYNLLAFGLSGVAILICIFIFCAVKKRRPFGDISFKKTQPKYWAVAALLAFGMLFGFTKLNDLFVGALKNLGYSKPDMAVPNETWWQYLLWIIVAAALPAFLEECLFRGYMADGFKDKPLPFTVLVGGLLFSLFHQNPQQTPYQFICGAAYFLLAIKCGCVLPCIAMHFFNNFAIFTFDFFSIELSPVASVVLTVLGITAFVIGIIWLLLPTKKAEIKAAESTANINDSVGQSPVNRTNTPFWLYAAAGIAICVIMWVSDLVVYLGR